MTLTNLPNELTAQVVRYLSLDDVCNLGLTSKRLQLLVGDDSLARLILEDRAPGSLEARQARITKRYAAALRRLLKRRNAITFVDPFAAAVVAIAESWIYVGGVLCYVPASVPLSAKLVRVLDLHAFSSTETVIDVLAVLRHHLQTHGADMDRCEARRLRKGLQNPECEVRPVHHAAGVTSVLYMPAAHEQRSWLVAVGRGGRCLAVVMVQRRDDRNMFVRNDAEFLFWGISSPSDHPGYKYWLIYGLELSTGAGLGVMPESDGLVGSEIGNNVHFDIFDGYLYALSSDLPLQTVYNKWKSYYTCFRIPLRPDPFRWVEWAPSSSMWRRDDCDGPIDNRWSFLRLVRDEASGQLQIVELRKERLSGTSFWRRHYYTKTLAFRSEDQSTDEGAGEGAGESEGDLASALSNDRGSSPGRTLRERRSATPSGSEESVSVHQGPGADEELRFGWSKCPLRSYHPPCRTYLDLVDDESQPSSTFDLDRIPQRIRVRGGGRVGLGPDDIVLWPRDPSPEAEEKDRPDQPQLRHRQHAAAREALYEVLNPSRYLGNVRGEWDGRSIVYATGGSRDGSRKGPKALVFVSFDPATHLRDIGRYPGLPPRSRGQSEEQAEKGDDDCPITRSDAKHPEEPDQPNRNEGLPAHAWMVEEPAMYRAIAQGFHFGL